MAYSSAALISECHEHRADPARAKVLTIADGSALADSCMPFARWTEAPLHRTPHISPLDIRPEGFVLFSRMTTQDREALDLLQGTLDLLILQTLATGRAHGHAIAHSIGRRSEDVLQVGHGSLYPALQRLMKLGLISAEDGTSENNRKARFYRLTRKGRRQLYTATSRWERFSAAMARVLAPPAEENS